VNNAKDNKFKQFSNNFNRYFQYNPSDLQVLKIFSPVVEKVNDGCVDIKKLKNTVFIRPPKNVPKAIKPLTESIPNYRKIPFDEICAAAEYIAGKISPDLRKHFVSMRNSGLIIDEQLTNEFDDRMWKVYIENTYTTDDVISVIHEMGHEICIMHDIIREIPSITTEFLADKILQKYHIPVPFFTTAKKKRIKEMIGDGDAVEFITDIFEEYEKNSQKMTPKIAEEFGLTNLDALKRRLNTEIQYFIGTAGSLVLADNIRDAKDYDETISVLSNNNIDNVRKLKKLNITPKTVETAFDKNI
jgi:uncharacterized protein YutE (UPF0331/DUF86 family)